MGARHADEAGPVQQVEGEEEHGESHPGVSLDITCSHTPQGGGRLSCLKICRVERRDGCEGAQVRAGLQVLHGVKLGYDHVSKDRVECCDTLTGQEF